MLRTVADTLASRAACAKSRPAPSPMPNSLHRPARGFVSPQPAVARCTDPEHLVEKARAEIACARDITAMKNATNDAVKRSAARRNRLWRAVHIAIAKFPRSLTILRVINILNCINVANRSHLSSGDCVDSAPRLVGSGTAIGLSWLLGLALTRRGSRVAKFTAKTRASREAQG
jgi:hypothetical protein